MRSNSVSPARLAAFEILCRVEDGAYASILIASKQPDQTQQDRALLQELVLGVLRNRLFLDTLIEHFANRKSVTLDQPVRIALQLGLYQLRFLSRIPASAAVNESVNITRIARVRSAGGFVNAVLRRAVREPDFDPINHIPDPIDRLSIESSHPRWLIERWSDAFGFDFTASLARANNIAPPLAFRVVRNRANESEVLARLEAGGAKLVPSRLVKGAWRLEGSASALLELAQRGEVYIQDEASQLVAEVLNPNSGELVLDLCAAPGSKTSQIADLAGNRARVIASDINEARLHTIVQTAWRHGLGNIQAVVLDGLEGLPFEQAKFDAVLVDAPCSGTGTFRRNPEIRWRISAADLQDLSSRQKQLLINAAGLIKPGGRLVYSTCSIEREENEEVVETFLANHRDFGRMDTGVNPLLVTESRDVRTWPHRDGSDGFFVAKFRRRGS